MDVGWNRTAAIWGAWDKESDTIYCYSRALPGAVALLPNCGGTTRPSPSRLSRGGLLFRAAPWSAFIGFPLNFRV
jgi:hypothetical protein